MKSLNALLMAIVLGNLVNAQRLDERYVDRWKQFYPSDALRQGMRSSIYSYDELDQESVSDWIAFNQQVLEDVTNGSSGFAVSDPIDARLLKVQAQSEIDRWSFMKLHANDASLYSRLIKNGLDPILDADYLTIPERNELVCRRLADILSLCESATNNLKTAKRVSLESAQKDLDEVIKFYLEEFPKITESWTLPAFCEPASVVIASIQKLKGHLENNVKVIESGIDMAIGRDEYARRLALYTDSDLTPETLEKMALKEIRKVKEIMGGVSRKYLRSNYPEMSLPEDHDEMIRLALADMEKDAPKNSREYLEFWRNLADDAVRFIDEHDIATQPDFQTLRIETAPESAGPAARIGWVDSAPPFDPNPVTTLYLPSIPENFPEEERIDFWSSFNKPFNRFIVIHELFPGHYMQIKISRESPHPVRLLFPYGIFIEGWATFTERVLLDAGWESDNTLTFLSHLRKRLENANRAYTSVQVHCNGWDQDLVMKFSTETSLLAPQFAKSLWGRISRSPMQLTSYFLGGNQFSELLAVEKERLGDEFVLKNFMDTILKTGPIPIDEFYDIFVKSYPTK